MIGRVRLSGFHCFGAEEVLSDLAAVNYIYGPNGSGKTTISQSLATVADDDSHIDWGLSPQTLKVYNRDYVRKAFTNADGEERGVFLLGEDSADTFTRIKELEAQHAKIMKKISVHQDTLDGKETAFEVQRSEIAEKVWHRRSVIPEAIKREMTGLSGSKAKCLKITLETARKFPERGEDTFESLLPKAEAAFSQTASEGELIPPAPPAPLDEDALQVALRTPIIGSSDVPLADMIERLGITDWVRQGADHLHAQGGSPVFCPFCQRIAPESLSDQLASIFDGTYQTKLDEIAGFQRAVESAIHSLAVYKEDNLEALQRNVEPAEVNQVFTAVEVSLEGIAKSVEQKMMTPSNVVDVRTVAESYAALVSTVGKANEYIADANAIVRDRKKQRPAIVNAAWQEYVRGHLDDLMEGFVKQEEEFTATIEGLRHAIAQQDEFLRECEIELRELRAQTTSSEATIRTINDMLAMSQFHSFKLEKAKRTEDGYRIIRDNGQLANIDTLSEGERTFITFLYFYHSLSEVKQDDETEKVGAVIDDPISSLDGDIMFVVSAITRELIRSVRKGEHDRVSQVVLLTHNTRFHNEVSYEHKGKESPRVKFYRIRKFSPEPSQVEDWGQKNPIRSGYQELWDEVATAQSRPELPMPWLPNVLRRILESYFSTLGGQGNLYQIGHDLKPAERALHNALVAWSHSGSHTIVDAEVFAHQSTSNERWLSAFARIFEQTSEGAHQGHYEMMMGEARKYIR